MNLFFILLLGTVQGLTEFLPVSSTGHLIIIEKLFNLSPLKFGLSFDIALHFGTLLALLFYFRCKIIKIITDFIRGNRQTGYLLLIGTIPALMVGVLLQKSIETIFRDPLFVALNLIIFSLVFFVAEKTGKRQKNFSEIKNKDSFIIGVFQAIALLPGVSRSGITISAALLRNLKENEAGEFAFLLSIPVMLAAFTKDAFDLLKQETSLQYFHFSVFGAGISFIVGLLCITYFLNYLKKHGLVPFIVYRIILAVVLLFLVITKNPTL